MIRVPSLLVAAILLATSSALAADPIRPDPKLTPGATLRVSAADVCKPGYSKTVRLVGGWEKAHVYKLYGIARRPGVYELDHLIPLALGGSNDARNLWPESFATEPWNAQVKDKLEERLHSLVCDQKISLREAQGEIAHDWIAAYKKYIGEPKTIIQPPSPGCVIKGNLNRKGERIYFRPGDLNYAQVNMAKPGTQWFCTEAEAKAAGWRPPAM
jgi:hypothetical protein